jgi:hypothetical protein
MRELSDRVSHGFRRFNLQNFYRQTIGHEMKEQRLHRLQVIVRVIDLVSNRLLVLESMDEESWMFYCEDNPSLFRFDFKAKSYDEARTKVKMLYWRFCLYNGDIDKDCSPVDFLRQRPQL